jgi:threonine aldolase
VRTNIIIFRLTDDGPEAATVVTRARKRDVLIFAFGPRLVRAVTHLGLLWPVMPGRTTILP